MSKSKKPKREFRPRTHAAVYMVGMVYLGFLIYDFVCKYQEGGPDAPSTGMLYAVVAALGAVMVVLGILTWRMYTMPEPEKKEGEEDGTDHEEDWDRQEWEQDKLDELDELEDLEKRDN